MLRMRRCRIIRILLYLVVVCTLTYLYLHNDLVFSASSPNAHKTKYADRATYEYTSLYRTHANHSFEDELDGQLQTLAHSVLSSEDIKANLTIHQITDPAPAAQYSPWVTQWQTNNPGWSYDLLTTYPTSLVSLFSSIPSVNPAYDAYPTLQPDLARYLMLWYYGGLYTDIDTWERVSLKDCSPIVETQTRDISLMVGVERDEPFFNWEEIRERGWTRAFIFGLGTVWAPHRFDPILRTAIVRSISHAHLQQTLAGGDGWMASFRGTDEWDLEEIEEISGAGMFTDIVLEFLSEHLKVGHDLRDRDAGLERRVSWKKFRGLKKAIWIEPNQAKDGQDMRGVAVLPINVWSSGQNHSSSGNFEAEGACVNHIYAPKAKKREWLERLFW